MTLDHHLAPSFIHHRLTSASTLTIGLSVDYNLNRSLTSFYVSIDNIEPGYKCSKCEVVYWPLMVVVLHLVRYSEDWTGQNVELVTFTNNFQSRPNIAKFSALRCSCEGTNEVVS